MNLLVYGGSGRVGGRILREAVQREHSVTAVVRNPGSARLGDPRAEIVTGDVMDVPTTAALSAGRDVVVSAVGAGIHGPNPEYAIYREAAEALVAALRSLADAPRLLVVGSAGSLAVDDGVRLLDTPDFPATYQEEALAQADALDYYRSVEDLEWTYISPPVLLEPGERTGQYRTAGDRLLLGAAGASRISIADHAVAFVDEIERPTTIRARLNVAY